MTSLQSRRESASILSGGISDDAVYRPILQQLRSLNPGNVVLDYGAGVGQLTSQLLASGIFRDVRAADMMARPVSLPDGLIWYQQDLNLPLRADSETFDAVVAPEVIEHLENPRATARDLFRILKPGGWVILSTPNNESLRSLLHLLLRGHFVLFADTCYPAHITALLRKDLERILVEAGFEPPRFIYSDHGGIPGRPRLTWQRVTRGLLRGRWWSDNIIALAQRPR